MVSTIIFLLGTSLFSFSTGFKQLSSFDNRADKKLLPSKTTTHESLKNVEFKKTAAHPVQTTPVAKKASYTTSTYGRMLLTLHSPCA